MASLKFIMDMDEDEPDPPQNKESGGYNPPASSRGHDPSRTATSSHETLQDPDDTLTSASTRRRGPTARSPRYTPTAPSTSTPTTLSTGPPPVRRRSTDSTDSMDHTGYGGHGQGSSSSSMTPSGRSNAPMRPVPSTSGEGNIPVKFTPITGRVSRAKKGVPVHICEICRPPKTFTRAEHLRRHQLSHKNPGFACTFPGCDKTFHRQDLLARHAQRHETDDKSSSKGTGGGDSRRTSTTSMEDPHPMGYMPHPPLVGGSGPRSMTGPSEMTSGPAYPGNTPSYQTMSHQGSSTGQTPMSPPQHPGRRDSDYRSPSAGPSQGHGYVLSTQSQIPIINPQPPSVNGSPITGTPFGLEFQPRTSSPYPVYMGAQPGLPHHLPSLTIPDNNVPGLLAPDASPWASSASDSNFSTPSEFGGQRRLVRSYGSPTSDWPGSTLYQPGTLRSPDAGLDTITTSGPFFMDQFSPAPHYHAYDLELPMQFPEEHTLIDHHAHPNNSYSSVRSPTPPTVSLSAQPAENLVTLAAAQVPPAPSTLGRRKDSVALVDPYLNATFLTAVTLSRPVRNAIPEYLDVYWKRFDTLFPLVHRRSFETAADEVLRCAMAAVGSQFLQGREDRIKGNTLHEFAYQEAKRYPQWNVQVMQTILLCEFFARFRGRKVVRVPSTSQPFQSLYSRVASYQTPSNYESTAASREERWNQWLDAEARRRLLASCFVLDVHVSVYYEHPLAHQFSNSTPPIPLTRPSADLWTAPSSDEWEALLTSKPNMEPATLPGEVLTPDRIATAPPFDRAILLASEALRLPKRPNPSILDLSVDMDPTSADRISKLFPGSAVAYTYLALHYTPLHDLLAVSGDSWLFTQKVLPAQNFQQHQKHLKQWSGSLHAGAAAIFAAKALLAFLDTNDNTIKQRMEEEERKQGRTWNMGDISDWWAMYVCTLVCWSLSHRATRGAAANVARAGVGSSSAASANANANAGAKAEREATGWLKMVAGLTAEEVLNVRGRREVAGVVSMVKRKLEEEAIGGKSRFLVDALGVLKKLEEGINWKWF